MRRSSFALALLVALLALVLPQAVSAKEGFPLRVVTPSGNVGWVRGSSADAAARYARKLFKRFTAPGHYWPVAYTAWLLSAEDGSMLYYPPTPLPYGTPGVVLTPAAQGGHGRRWDHW